MKNFSHSVFFVLVCGFFFDMNVCDGQTKRQNAHCAGFQDSTAHRFIYKTADRAPEPVGETDVLFKQLGKKMKFPKGLEESVGRVIIAFIVEPDGRIDGERVVKNPFGMEYHITDQLFAIIHSLKWQPGTCGNTPVAVLYTLPVNIELSAE